jgi:hypothetical protein
MWGNIPTPHGPCSYCHDPYHHVRDCPSTRQFSNHSYEYMNTSSSRLGDDGYFDSYNPTWSQQSNLLWHAQVHGNPSTQFYFQSYSCLNPSLRQSIFKIESQEEESSPIYDHSFSYPHRQYQEEPPPSKGSALEEASSTLKEEMSAYLSQMEESKRSFERMENSRKQSFERMEAHLKQISDILKEEEEECQSQSMTTPHGYYMEE